MTLTAEGTKRVNDAVRLCIRLQQMQRAKKATLPDTRNSLYKALMRITKAMDSAEYLEYCKRTE